MSVHQDCRMYEQKYPEVDDVVMVQVRGLCLGRVSHTCVSNLGGFDVPSRPLCLPVGRRH